MMTLPGSLNPLELADDVGGEDCYERVEIARGARGRESVADVSSMGGVSFICQPRLKPMG